MLQLRNEIIFQNFSLHSDITFENSWDSDTFHCVASLVLLRYSWKTEKLDFGNKCKSLACRWAGTAHKLLFLFSFHCGAM